MLEDGNKFDHDHSNTGKEKKKVGCVDIRRTERKVQKAWQL